MGIKPFSLKPFSVFGSSWCYIVCLSHFTTRLAQWLKSLFVCLNLHSRAVVIMPLPNWQIQLPACTACGVRIVLYLVLPSGGQPFAEWNRTSGNTHGHCSFSVKWGTWYGRFSRVMRRHRGGEDGCCFCLNQEAAKCQAPERTAGLAVVRTLTARTWMDEGEAFAKERLWGTVKVLGNSKLVQSVYRLRLFLLLWVWWTRFDWATTRLSWHSHTALRHAETAVSKVEYFKVHVNALSQVTSIVTVCFLQQQISQLFWQIKMREVKMLKEQIFKDSQGQMLHALLLNFKITKPDSSVWLIGVLPGIQFQPHPDWIMPVLATRPTSRDQIKAGTGKNLRRLMMMICNLFPRINFRAEHESNSRALCTICLLIRCDSESRIISSVCNRSSERSLSLKLSQWFFIIRAVLKYSRHQHQVWGSESL